MPSTKDTESTELAALRAEVEAVKAALAQNQHTTGLLSKDSGRVAADARRSTWDAWYEMCREISQLPVQERADKLLVADGDVVRRVLQFLDIEGLAQTLDACGKSRTRILSNITGADMSAAEYDLKIKIHRSKAVPRVRVTMFDQTGSIATSEIRGARRSDTYPGFRIVGVRYMGTNLGSTFKIFPTAYFEKLLAIDSELRDHVTKGALIVEPLSDEESKGLSFTEIRDTVRKNLHLATRPGSGLGAWSPGESIEAVMGHMVAENNGGEILTDHIQAHALPMPMPTKGK